MTTFVRKARTDKEIGLLIIEDLPEKLLNGLRSGDIMGALEYYLNFHAESFDATTCLVYADVSEIETLISQGRIDDLWLSRCMDLKDEIHIELQAETESLAYNLNEGFEEAFARA